MPWWDDAAMSGVALGAGGVPTLEPFLGALVASTLVSLTVATLRPARVASAV